MQILPKSAWRYAVLIIVLFAIVAVASTTIIAHLHDQIPGPNNEAAVRQLSIAIWSLTMGCMFLAGALGLWGIRSSVEIEGRRRIARFVDTMDYLSDGLLALDFKGRIRGANPAARRMAQRPFSARKAEPILNVFPCLQAQDIDQLLDRSQPCETERSCEYGETVRTLRFRSQPSEELMLVLVSDITNRYYQDMRRRQVAQLHVIGRIAAGVAHDFNNILCAVSGHATLLQRFSADPETVRRSLAVIAEETQRGSLLSRQLLELSRLGSEGKPSRDLQGNLDEAAGLLRVALSPQWTVCVKIMGEHDAAVPLTPVQVEQVVLNLGLLAADAQAQPGAVTIMLNRPGEGPLLDVGDRFAAVILISGESSPSHETGAGGLAFAADVSVAPDDGGVIASVVRTLVEEAHGRFDQLSAPGGLCVYRVCLPRLDSSCDGGGILPSAQIEQRAVLGRCRVLLAGADHVMEPLARKLRATGAAVERQKNVLAAFARIEQTRALDAMILDYRLSGAETGGLLKSFHELCPHVAMIVIGVDPELTKLWERPGLRCLANHAGSDKILRALVETCSEIDRKTGQPQAF